MALNAKNIPSNTKSKTKQAPIEPGVYPARLVQILDLGVQAQRPYQGKDKPPVQEIMLTYELVDCFMLDENGKELEDKPRWVSETLPFYGLYADKAKSTQRYHAFDPNEEYGGDFSKAIGQAVNVTIVNNAVGDTVYTNVATVSTMRPRDVANCPPLVNDPKVFDLDNPSVETFKALPEWLQDKIKSNLNFQGSPLENALLGKDVPKPKEKAPPPPPPPEADDEDAPY